MQRINARILQCEDFMQDFMQEFIIAISTPAGCGGFNRFAHSAGPGLMGCWVVGVLGCSACWVVGWLGATQCVRVLLTPPASRKIKPETTKKRRSQKESPTTTIFFDFR